MPVSDDPIGRKGSIPKVATDSSGSTRRAPGAKVLQKVQAGEHPDTEQRESGISSKARAVFSRPPGAAFLLACLLALPILSLFPHGVSIRSSDSAVVLNTASYVNEVDPSWLLKSQEPALLQLVYGPWLDDIESSRPLIVIPLLTTVLLVGIAGSLAARVTASTVAGVFAALLLMSMRVPIPQARLLPLYSGFIAAGMLGVWFAIKFVRDDSTLRLALGASLLVLGAMIAHGAGLYFLTLVLAMALFVSNRETLERYLKLVAIQLAVLSPWLLSHLWHGGLEAFLSPRSTWFVVGGHLGIVTRDFWDQGVFTAGDLVTLIPQQFLVALGWTAWLALPLSVLGFLKLALRSRLFVIVATLGLVAPMALYSTRVFDRYFYPLLPGLAILAALGAVSLARIVKSSRHGRVVPVLGILLPVVLVGSLLSLTNTLAVANEDEERQERKELRRVGRLINDDRAVIASRRSTVIALEAPDVFVYYADVLSEREFVSFMTWHRDSVIRLLKERDIGWALIRKPQYVEVSYNSTWMEPAYGEKPTYAKALQSDPMSCLVHHGQLYKLYKLTPPASQEGRCL